MENYYSQNLNDSMVTLNLQTQWIEKLFMSSENHVTSNLVILI